MTQYNKNHLWEKINLMSTLSLSLAQLLPIMIEVKSFTTYTTASHQRPIAKFWALYCGALMLSIYIVPSMGQTKSFLNVG